LQEQNDTVQIGIERALIECLKIFAARRRQLRLQRERDQAKQEVGSENAEEKMEDDKAPRPSAQKEPQCQP